MSQQIDEYPNNINPEMSREGEGSSHSNGSFGPVFAVLAVIVVISAVACVVGRLCSKRGNRVKKEAGHGNKGGSKSKSKHNQAMGLPKEWESKQKPSFNMRDGMDIEFGFDKKMPPGKGPKTTGGGGGGKPKPPHQNGGHKPDIRFSNNV